MIDRDNGKVLIFIHIPKTAGSTLQQVVYSNYSGEEICVLGKPNADDNQSGRSFGEIYRRDLDSIKSGLRQKNSELKILFGHMEFGMHKYFLNGGQYATMLRHPVARVVSHYNFVRRSPAHYLHEKVMGGALSLGEYIEGTGAKELNNGQVRVLYGEAHKRIAFNLCKPEHLDEALSNIADNFVFVGVQEKFRECVERLAGIMDWDIPEIENRNVSDESDVEISAETVEKILAFNTLDMMLYEKIYRSI